MIIQILTSFIFLLSLWLIFSEKINRGIAGMLGAILIVGLGKILHFYSEADAIEALDFNTLGLLLGMMVLVALLEPTGFFQFLAVWAGRLSRGRPVLLILLLGTITTLISMFLNNVTTVVLIAPVTILICEILGLNPNPYLLAEALLANTGGVATLVGDPPNIMVASVAGFSFNDFLIHSFPIVVIVWFTALWLLYRLFHCDLSLIPPNAEVVLKLNPSESLDDVKTAKKVLIVLIGAIIFFFLGKDLNLSPAYVALSAAGVVLMWIHPDIPETLRRIDWSLLIFIASLFVLVGGLVASGILDNIVTLLEKLNTIPPVIFGLLTLWLTAILSAFIDNVPITVSLIPIIHGLGVDGMNIQPLWWALVFGAGFGGNGTIIGSSANIVVATLSERTRTPITSKLWNKRGLPVMLLTCGIASIIYVLAFPLFSR